jgi:hypothetical protein
MKAGNWINIQIIEWNEINGYFVCFRKQIEAPFKLLLGDFLLGKVDLNSFCEIYIYFPIFSEKKIEYLNLDI